jgi:hypothetical protein
MSAVLSRETNTVSGVCDEIAIAAVNQNLPFSLWSLVMYTKGTNGSILAARNRIAPQNCNVNPLDSKDWLLGQPIRNHFPIFRRRGDDSCL